MCTIHSLALLAVRPAHAAAANRSNIILILAEDLGGADLGCYGQEKALTPRIDALAADGLPFTQASAGSTVCAPSRCSLMTGLHNGHNRIRGNLPHGVDRAVGSIVDLTSTPTPIADYPIVSRESVRP